MAILLGISIVAGLLAVFFLARTFSSLKRRRPMRAGGACLGCVTSAAIAGAGSMLLVSYLSYQRLTEETPVASIEFRRVSPDEFQARLMRPERLDEFFVLRGDEWQIDARIVTWKPPMTVLGLDPIYQLTRLAGRYGEIDREINEVRTVHALSGELPVDVWHAARRFPMLLPGIDAHYGTATFVPMVDGARFDVSLSRDALIARPANEPARRAVGNWGQP